MSRGKKEQDAEPKLLPFQLAFYEVSIEERARLAVRSFLAYGHAISAGNEDVEAAGYLHEGLTHCASISRFFWPVGNAGVLAKHRAELLRKHYAVDETSPLADRKLRNALEHFDERLDDWILHDPVGPIIASPIVANHRIVDEGFGHVFKLIDPENDVFVVLGKKFKFGPLAQEVARILMKDNQASEQSLTP